MDSYSTFSFNPVISKFIEIAQIPKIKQFLLNISKDKLDDQRNGPFADRLEHNVVPKWNKWVNTHSKEMPQDLLKLCIKFRGKMGPRSTYRYDDLKTASRAYERDLRVPKWKDLAQWQAQQFISNYQLENVFPQSISHEFDTTGLDLSKGAGPPQMGPKRDQLNPARLYADKIRNDPSTPAYPNLCGFRTQFQKIRLIWQDPISEWVPEVEAFRDSIKRATEACGKGTKFVSLYYCTPEQLSKFILEEGFECIVVIDTTQFDATMTAWEIDDGLRYIAGNYDPGMLNHIIDHAIRAPVVMPDGNLERFGGWSSGKLPTNLIDGLRQLIRCIRAFKFLEKYIIKWFVNGDDIGFVASTAIRPDNIDKAAKDYPGEIDPEKSWISSKSAFFSKVYFDPNLEGPCKTGYQVLQNSIHVEFQTGEGIVDKGYLAVATAQRCEWLRYHPGGEYLVRLIKKEDKYPIETLDDSIVELAVQRYRSRNAWIEETGGVKFLDNIQTDSFYASVSA